MGVAFDFPNAPIDGQVYTSPLGTYYRWNTFAWTVGSTESGGPVVVDWTDISNKPSTFPPTLPIPESGVTNLIADLAAKQPLITAGTTSQYYRGDKTFQTLDKTAVGLANVDNTSDAAKPLSSIQIAAFNLTELKSNKGAANGYAPLDATGSIPSTYLPAYVDDVLEYANLAAFPATGTPGVIYVALNTNKSYRWSGSTYVEMSSSPGSTDAVPEGSINKYYTTARAQADVNWFTIAGKPATFPPTLPITQANVTGLVAALAGKEATIAPANPFFFYGGDKVFRNVDWAWIASKPSTFPPSTHTHVISDVTDLGTLLAATEPAIATGNPAYFWAGDKTWKAVATDWSSLSGKPSTFPADPETVDDRVAALLVAGANITLTYNDVANSLTIASAGSGGGGIAEAPSDGSDYVRNNGAWVILDYAALDGKPPTYPATAHVHPQTDITNLVTDLAAKEPLISTGSTAQYRRGDKTWQTLNKAAVGLSNVDNTSDVNKPMSDAMTEALTRYVPVSGGSMTGSLIVSESVTIATGAPVFDPVTQNVALAARTDGQMELWWDHGDQHLQFYPNGVVDFPVTPTVGGVPIGGGGGGGGDYVATDGSTTMTGTLSISQDTGYAYIAMNKTDDAYFNGIVGQRDTNGRWWLILGDNNAESGGNSGSNLVIQRHDDTGGYLGAPLRIDRASGVVDFEVTPTVGGSPISGGGSGGPVAASAVSAVPGYGLTGDDVQEALDQLGAGKLNGNWPYITGGMVLDGLAGSVNINTTTRGTTGASVVGFNIITKSADAADYLGNSTAKGWNFYARGDAWSVGSEQNDFGLTYWSGSTWTTVMNIDSLTGVVDMPMGAKVGGSVMLTTATGQALDATLTALAGLNTTAGLVEQTGTDTFTKRLIGVANTTDIPTRANGDARWQTLDATLTALAGLNTTAGLVEQTGTDTFTKATVTTFGKSLIDDADATAGRATLGIGSMATRAFTVSTSDPSGGADGDIWFKTA